MEEEYIISIKRKKNNEKEEKMTKMMRFGWIECRKPFVFISAIRIGYKGNISLIFSLRGIGICGISQIIIAQWKPFRFIMINLKRDQE